MSTSMHNVVLEHIQRAGISHSIKRWSELGTSEDKLENSNVSNQQMLQTKQELIATVVKKSEKYKDPRELAQWKIKNKNYRVYLRDQR